jgi:hypothetical protein
MSSKNIVSPVHVNEKVNHRSSCLDNGQTVPHFFVNTNVKKGELLFMEHCFSDYLKCYVFGNLILNDDNLRHQFLPYVNDDSDIIKSINTKIHTNGFLSDDKYVTIGKYSSWFKTTYPNNVRVWKTSIKMKNNNRCTYLSFIANRDIRKGEMLSVSNSEHTFTDEDYGFEDTIKNKIANYMDSEDFKYVQENQNNARNLYVDVSDKDQCSIIV